MAKSSELNRTFSVTKAVNWSTMAAIVLSGKGARSTFFRRPFLSRAEAFQTRRREDDDDDVTKKRTRGGRRLMCARRRCDRVSHRAGRVESSVWEDARLGRIGRPSPAPESRSRRGDARSRTSRASSLRWRAGKTRPERARVSAPPQRACLKWRAAETGPSPPSGSRDSRRRSGCCSQLRARPDGVERLSERRIDSPVLTCDESTDAARLVQIAHVTASRDDPIATCLVPRDRFSGRALAYQGARTHLLCPTAGVRSRGA